MAAFEQRFLLAAMGAETAVKTAYQSALDAYIEWWLRTSGLGVAEGDRLMKEAALAGAAYLAALSSRSAAEEGQRAALQKQEEGHEPATVPGWTAESQRAAVAPTVRKRGRPSRVPPEPPVIDIYNPGFE